MAADKASSFHYIQTYLVDIEVLRNEASTAVSEMEQDKDGIRFDLNTPAGDVVNNPNFFNMNVVANNVEVPYQTVATTRTEMWTRTITTECPSTSARPEITLIY